MPKRYTVAAIFFVCAMLCLGYVVGSRICTKATKPTVTCAEFDAAVRYCLTFAQTEGVTNCLRRSLTDLDQQCEEVD